MQIEAVNSEIIPSYSGTNNVLKSTSISAISGEMLGSGDRLYGHDQLRKKLKHSSRSSKNDYRTLSINE